MDPSLEADVRILNAVTTQESARRYVKRARYRRVNARRAELIYADTPADDPELRALQECTMRLVHLAYPLPVSDLGRKLDELEARLSQTEQQQRASSETQEQPP
jgi:hypothetical protein